MATQRGTKKKTASASKSRVTAARHTNADVAAIIYNDSLAPAVREAGSALAMAFAIVNTFMAASCLKIAYGGAFAERCRERMRAKLSTIPEERRLPPPPEVVGPLLAHYPYVAEKHDLREMFENLLASSTDSGRVTHPSFVEILKQINVDEAKLLTKLHHEIARGSTYYFPVLIFRAGSADNSSHQDIGTLSLMDLVEGLEKPASLAVYEDNLERLSLIRLHLKRTLSDKARYSELEAACANRIARTREQIEKEGKHPRTEYGAVEVTSLGVTFLRACIGEISPHT